MATDGDWSVHWVLDGSGGARMAAVGARTAGYVGVGFSSDGAMVGSDAVIGWCGEGGASVVGAYYLGGKGPSSVTPTSTFSVSDTSAECVDGATTIAFTIDAATAPPLLSTDSPTKFVWALSDTKGISFHGRSGTLQLSLVSGGAASVSRPFAVYRWQLIHGVLMFASWGIILPIGGLVPRLLRRTLSRNGRWFRLHRGLQVGGLLISIAGLSIALSRPEFGTLNTLHGYLGLGVMVLGVLQPVNAYFRPHPPKADDVKSCGRLLWELLHKLSGWVALGFAIVTIFLGFPLYSRASGAVMLSSGVDQVEQIGYVVYGCFLAGLVAWTILTLLRNTSASPSDNRKDPSGVRGVELVKGDMGHNPLSLAVGGEPRTWAGMI